MPAAFSMLFFTVGTLYLVLKLRANRLVASIHRDAAKVNSRKPISRCLHKVAPQADVMGRYALYSHLSQPQDIGGVYKDSKIAPSVVVDQRALPVVIAEHQYVLLPRRLQPLIPPPEFWP